MPPKTLHQDTGHRRWRPKEQRQKGNKKLTTAGVPRGLTSPLLRKRPGSAGPGPCPLVRHLGLSQASGGLQEPGFRQLRERAEKRGFPGRPDPAVAPPDTRTSRCPSEVTPYPPSRRHPTASYPERPIRRPLRSTNFPPLSSTRDLPTALSPPHPVVQSLPIGCERRGRRGERKGALLCHRCGHAGSSGPCACSMLGIVVFEPLGGEMGRVSLSPRASGKYGLQPPAVLPASVALKALRTEINITSTHCCLIY